MVLYLYNGAEKHFYKNDFQYYHYHKTQKLEKYVEEKLTFVVGFVSRYLLYA